MKGMKFGDYVALVEYDEETEGFNGRVANIPEVVNFWGASVEDLKREFEASISTYEELCQERGIAPSKPYRGDFLVRMDPVLHRRVAVAAALSDEKSLNAWVTKVLEREVDDAGV